MRRKGLQDIRTHAGRATTPGSSVRSYIRLSTLEMERVRRQRELDEAQARADAARDRVERLSTEIDEIVSAIANAAPVPPPNAARGLPHDDGPGEIVVTHAYGAPRAPGTKKAAKKAVAAADLKPPHTSRKTETNA